MTRRDASIIGIIICLGLFMLLAFLSKLRSIEQRIRCTDNLKQLALGLMDYNQSRGSLPMGTRANNSLPPERRLSWLVTILPYAEGKSGFEKFDKDQAWDSEHNMSVSVRTSKLFWCPGNSDAQDSHSPDRTSYVGMAGIGIDAPSLVNGDARAGVFGYDRALNVREVCKPRDSVLMVIETSLDNGYWTAGGQATVRGLSVDQVPYIGKGRQFGGMHPGGVNVMYLDGSVGFLSESIGPDEFSSLCTLRGGRDTLLNPVP
jgi:prepilin-type processing-associated H-X9-DG protein